MMSRIFGQPVLIWEDTRRDYREDRFRAIGETDGDILHVAFTWAWQCAANHLGKTRQSKGSTAVAITKMTSDEIMALPSKRNRARIETTTEEEIRRQMIEDGEKPDEELSENEIISPWYIRKKLSMSQRQFAETLGVPVATLRNWEQNRVAMEPATIALMRILAREPEAALRALRRRAA
jgi:putative transcriptional regulator